MQLEGVAGSRAHWPGEVEVLPGHLLLFHTRQDESWRMHRLRAVAASLARSAPETFRMLLRLHDHKGRLEVHWRGFPSGDFTLMEFLWAEQAECLVSHFLSGGGLRTCDNSVLYRGAEDPTPVTEQTRASLFFRDDWRDLPGRNVRDAEWLP